VAFGFAMYVSARALGARFGFAMYVSARALGARFGFAAVPLGAFPPTRLFTFVRFFIGATATFHATFSGAFATTPFYGRALWWWGW